MIHKRLLFGTFSQLILPVRQSRTVLWQRHPRHASTTSTASSRVWNFLYGSSAILLVSLGYVYVTDTRASIHRYVIPPLVQFFYPDPEDAHQSTTAALKELYTVNLHPREREKDDKSLAVEVFCQLLPNPIGISGGLDKHADIPDALFALGASVVEIGGVTPHPQDGNPKPRVFRIPSEEALVNRYGLPSEGADIM